MNTFQSTLFRALGCIGLAGFAQGAEPDIETINIVSGAYDSGCHSVSANATRRLARRCDGLRTCEYVLDQEPGRHSAACRPGFRAEWRCGRGEFHEAFLSAAAKPGDTLVLSCVRQNGPGR